MSADLVDDARAVWNRSRNDTREKWYMGLSAGRLRRAKNILVPHVATDLKALRRVSRSALRATELCSALLISSEAAFVLSKDVSSARSSRMFPWELARIVSSSWFRLLISTFMDSCFLISALHVATLP